MTSVNVKKDDSPWGHADFAPTETGLQSTSAYNWGNEEPSGDEFFNSLLDDNKVRNNNK